MSFTNFAALQSLTSVGGTDQFLVSLDNGLSGADGFGRVATAAMNKSLGVYSTVQTNSANWTQTLSFNAINAQLSISSGNTISLSSLSAAPGAGIDTGVRALTSNWQSTYTTVSSNSATWGTGGGSGLTIFRQVSSTVSPNNTTIVHALSVNSLSANVDVAIAARGTGATLAQIPNGATSGGNKRGQYATDWQKLRNGSGQVASGNHSTIGGGRDNTASGDSTTVAGGQNNTANNLGATVAGGISNNANNTYAAIGGGASNTAGATVAVVAGGLNNNASNAYSTIGGGISNNASGSHAAIAGGNTNSAGGYTAAIGGGERNIASGTYATIPGGYSARALNHGQYAYASNFYATQGDAQHFQYVLYGTSVNGAVVVLTPNGANYSTDNAAIPSLFVPGQDMAAILTVQVIGFDDTGNCSHSLTKLVVRKLAGSAFNEELLVNTTIGTDGASAGAVAFAINTNTTPEHVFTVTGSSIVGDQTRWVAHVSGTWVYQPPAYP